MWILLPLGSLVQTWMDLETAMLSIQKENKCHTLMYNVSQKKWYRRSYLQSTENKRGHQGGRGSGRNKKAAVDTHAIDTMYRLDSWENILCSTGTSYFMHCGDLNEKEFQRKRKYTCMAHSFHCTVETLESSYTPIKLNKKSKESPHSSNIKSKKGIPLQQ